MSGTVQNQQHLGSGRGRRRLKIPVSSPVSANTDQKDSSVSTAKLANSNLNSGIFAPLPLAQPNPLLSFNVTSTSDKPLKGAPDTLKPEKPIYQPTSTDLSVTTQPALILNVSPPDTIFPLLPSTNPLAVCRYIDSILSFCEIPQHRLLYLAIRFRLELISTDDNYQSLFLLDASPFLQELRELELAQAHSSSSTLAAAVAWPHSTHQAPDATLEDYMSSHSIQETFDFLLNTRDYYNAYLLASSCSNNAWITQLFNASKDVSPAVFRFLNDILPALSSSGVQTSDIDAWPAVLLWFIKTIIRAPKGSWNPDFLGMQKRYFLKLLLHGYILEAQLSGIALGYILEPGSYATFIQNNANLLHASVSALLDLKPVTALPNHMAQAMFINPQQPLHRQKLMASTSSIELRTNNLRVITQIFVEDIKEKQQLSPEMLLLAELVEYAHMATYFYCAAKVRGRFFPPEPKSIFDSGIHQNLTLFPHLLPYKVHEILSRGYVELALRFLHTLLVIIPEQFTNTPFVASAYDNCTVLPSVGKTSLPPAEVLPTANLRDAIGVTNNKKGKKGLQSLTTLVWSEPKIRTVKIVPTVSFSAILLPLSPVAMHAWSELTRIGTDIKSRRDSLPETAFIAHRLSRQLSEKVFLLGALTIRQSCNISTISDSAFPGYDSASEILPSCNTSMTSECSGENKQQTGGGTLLSNLGKKATTGLGKLFGTLDPETDRIVETPCAKESQSTNQSQFLQQPLQTGPLNPFTVTKQAPTSPSILHHPYPHNRSSSWLKDVSEGVDTHTGPDISFSDELAPLQCTQPAMQPPVSKPPTEISPDIAFFNEAVHPPSVSSFIPSAAPTNMPVPLAPPPIPTSVSAATHAPATQYATTVRRNAVRARAGPMRHPMMLVPTS
ncbi:Hypothetical protein GLP15_2266 [Giardia lamblia P15]|uniref:Uncharacterized protein n=1 Tax=Giardia intestinalis (strain P15) TaxID=658858 RepID=E1F8P8_GIAIA|nr:Hypothetical protein GLP15_2266 [Giardia lamblia P15]